MADREEIKKLVKEALEGAGGDESPKGGASTVGHVVVNSLKKDVEKKWDRDESSKSFLTDNDLQGLEFGSTVRVSAGVKLTPLAQDLVAENGLVLVEKVTRDTNFKVSSVAIGCDHGGFETKEMLKKHLTALGLKVRDFGTDSKDAVDYPDFAHAVARAVAENVAEAGIIIDGAGIGSAMAANKVNGVRAAACYSEELARNSREHNGANVLTLGSGQNSKDEIKRIVETFLTSDISESRHKKRVGKIDAIERQYRGT